MKKAMVVLMLLLSAAVLFAGSYVQTIVLMSVVEEVEPGFCLEVSHVENGYGYTTSGKEASIVSCNVKENVKADFNIRQDFSRYRGEIGITVSVSELCWNGYHTENLQISGKVNEVGGRWGYAEISGNEIKFNLNYSGYVEISSAAEFSVEYNGNQQLPNETYVSYVTMVVEVK